MSIIHNAALRHYAEFFACDQVISTTPTVGNGQAGKNPQNIANVGGRWGVIISASKDKTLTIPNNGTFVIQMSDTKGNVGTLTHTNRTGRSEVYNDTQKVLQMNASNVFTYQGGPLTLTFSGGAGTSGTFDASPYYNAS